MLTRPSRRRVPLARALSKKGFCSRSKAAELIRAGRVSVNGLPQLDPERLIDLERAQIRVDESRLVSAPFVYCMVNKPRGVVTTASDKQGRRTVLDLLPAKSSWLAPVGRLDKASEGLLLLTNDSEWGASILAPASHLEKTYHVQIARRADDDLLQKVRAGVGSGKIFLRVKSVEMVRTGATNSWLEIRLDEGKNRQIRRIFDAMNIEVLRLIRIAIGPLALGALPKGMTRELTHAEKDSLDRALDGMHRKTAPRKAG
jgi:23S rRNA pseudouridine2605 synthase